MLPVLLWASYYVTLDLFPHSRVRIMNITQRVVVRSSEIILKELSISDIRELGYLFYTFKASMI